MSFEVYFRSRVASIMETLTATALQDICQLMEETCAALRVEMRHEHNQSTSSIKTKLNVKENRTEMEKPANCMEIMQKPGLRNFPVVEQILNQQEANGLWLEGDPSEENEVPWSLLPEREEPSQPFAQTRYQEVETWQAPLNIKQEEMDDNDMEFQGYGEWVPGAYGANQNNPEKSDEQEKSQSSGGAGKLTEFKRQHGSRRRSTGVAVAPKKRSHSSYTCEICGKTETKKCKLASHMITHTGMPYSCDVCGEKFILLNFLVRHKQSKHTLKTYNCSLCEKTFTKAGFRDNHERSHSEKKYRCSDCGETFKERGDRDAHKCIVFTGKQLFNCSECHENFDRQYHLKRHQLEKHPFMVHQTFNTEVKSKDFQDQEGKQQSVGENIEKPYGCSACPMVFVYRKSRDNHERKHIGQVRCSDCGKTFKEWRQREAHKCIYKVEQSFRCSVCGKDYEKQYSLKRHQMEKHPVMADQSVEPELDSEDFQDQEGEQQSVEEKIEKPYSCSGCPMVFVYRKSRDNHERKHIGEDYCCSDCGKTFKEWQERNAHECIVYKGEQSFRCSVCGKDFERQSLLKRHQLEKPSDGEPDCRRRT